MLDIKGCCCCTQGKSINTLVVLPEINCLSIVILYLLSQLRVSKLRGLARHHSNHYHHPELPCRKCLLQWISSVVSTVISWYIEKSWAPVYVLALSSPSLSLLASSFLSHFSFKCCCDLISDYFLLVSLFAFNWCSVYLSSSPAVKYNPFLFKSSF